MSEPVVAAAVRLSRKLPAGDVRQLAAAARQGAAAVQQLRAVAAGAVLRSACDKALTLDLINAGPEFAGALLGALEADRVAAAAMIDVVWTGPDSDVGTSRLTSAVIVELIDEARTDVLLVGYAVHTEPTVAGALSAAAARGVTLTLLLERTADNPGFTGHGTPFPGLAATRLCWPGGARPVGASLHAKVLVVDGRAALIGSANVTGAALGRNLECGLLVRGGPHPGQVRDHVRSLRRLGVVVTV